MSRDCPHCEGTGKITVGLVVRKARKKKRITQGELAERVGMSRPAVANIEVGRQNIMPENIRKFAEVLGVETDELIP